MKFKFIYSFATLFFLAFLFSSNNNGRANEQGWGNTGAPGDQTLVNGDPRTCISCHGTSSAIQVGLNIDIADGNGNSITNTGYTPGETYDVTVTISTLAGSPSAVGFQIVALNAPLGENGNDISDWSPISSNVQVSSASNTGRTYVEHVAPSQSSNEFKMSWTAPEDLEGEVTFYSCGNGVNLNGSTSGDNAACNTLVITQDQTSSNNDLDKASLQVQLFPNPVTDQVNLNISAKNAGEYALRVYNSIGQQVYQEIINLTNGENPESIDMSNLSQGVYTVQIQNERQIIAKNIIKL